MGTTEAIDKNDIERYAYLKGVMKDVEKEIKEIGPRLKEGMIAGNTEEIVSEFGKFSFTPFRVWSYPQEIIELEEKIERMKEEAQQRGSASYEERKDLKFYPKKNA